MSFEQSAHILHSLNPELHRSAIVESSARHVERTTGENPSGNAEGKIEAYLGRIAHMLGDHRLRRRLADHVRNEIVTRMGDVPESYWEQTVRFHRQQGHPFELWEADGSMSEAMRHHAKELERTQIRGVDSWFEHFQAQTPPYPLWYTHFALSGMAKLGRYNPDRQQFNRRSGSNVGYVAEAMPGAIRGVYETIDGQAAEGEVERASFSRLYSQQLDALYPTVTVPDNPEEIDGEWRRYEIRQRAQLIEASQRTPWCTVSSEQVDKFLESRNFFDIYHLRDPQTGIVSATGVIALRRSGWNGTIHEHKGLLGGQEQLVHPQLVGIMNEWIGKDAGANPLQQEAVRKRLNELDAKNLAGQDLTLDELLFVYEINEEIPYAHERVTSEIDPRIVDIRKNRARHFRQFAEAYGEGNAFWMTTPPQELYRHMADVVADHTVNLPQFLRYAAMHHMIITDRNATEAALARVEGDEIDDLFRLMMPASRQDYLEQALEKKVSVRSLDRLMDSTRIIYGPRLVDYGVDPKRIAVAVATENQHLWSIPFVQKIAEAGIAFDVKQYALSALSEWGRHRTDTSRALAQMPLDTLIEELVKCGADREELDRHIATLKLSTAEMIE